MGSTIISLVYQARNIKPRRDGARASSLACLFSLSCADTLAPCAPQHFSSNRNEEHEAANLPERQMQQAMAHQQEIAVRRATAQMRGGFVTYNEMHKVYVWICHTKGVSPDATLINSLCDGHIRADLDHFDEKGLSALNAFLHACEPSDILSARLACGEDSRRRRFKQQLSRLGLTEPLIMRSEHSARLCRAMASCLCEGHMVELKLVGIRLAQPALRALSSALKKNSSLRHLSLKKTELCDTGLAVCAGAIATHRQLQLVCVSHCHLTERSIGAITRIIKAHAMRRDELRWAKSLRQLHLADVTVQEHEETQLEGLLGFDLSFNMLGNEAVACICDTLLFDIWLLGINLRHNRVGAKGAAAMDRLLASNNTLVAFDVRHNDGITVARQRAMRSLLAERSPPALLFRAAQEATLEGGSLALVGELLGDWGCRTTQRRLDPASSAMEREAGHSISAMAPMESLLRANPVIVRDVLNHDQLLKMEVVFRKVAREAARKSGLAAHSAKAADKVSVNVRRLVGELRTDADFQGSLGAGEEDAAGAAMPQERSKREGTSMRRNTFFGMYKTPTTERGRCDAELATLLAGKAEEVRWAELAERFAPSSAGGDTASSPSRAATAPATLNRRGTFFGTFTPVPQFATRKATLSAADFSKTLNLAELAAKDGAAAAARPRTQQPKPASRKPAWNAGSSQQEAQSASPLRQVNERASQLQRENVKLRAQLASAQGGGSENLQSLEHSMERLAASVGAFGKTGSGKAKIQKRRKTNRKRKGRASSSQADLTAAANDEHITHQVAGRLRDLFQLGDTS